MGVKTLGCQNVGYVGEVLGAGAGSGSLVQIRWFEFAGAVCMRQSLLSCYIVVG